MLKRSIHELKNNIYINALICIQFVIVLVLSISVSSIVVYYYKYYNSFKDYFESDGYLYITEYVYVNDENSLAYNTDQIEDILTGAEVTGTYELWAYYFDADGNPMEMTSIGYDDEIIDAFTPELEEGAWLSNDENDGSYIEAVVSANDDDIQVGDIILVNNIYYDNDLEKAFKVKIVGKLSDGAKIVGYTENAYGANGDYRDVYCDYYLEDEETPVLLFNAESFLEYAELHGDSDTQPIVNGVLFVTFSEDLTDEEIISNQTILTNYVNRIDKNDLSSIKEKSKDNLEEKVFSIIPIFIGAFVLAIVSSLCSIAVSVKKQMKNYAIYSICGMNWKTSSVISIINTFILAVISLLLSILSVCVISAINTETTMCIGAYQLICCVGVIIIYIIISAIMPSLIINGTSINEILRNND